MTFWIITIAMALIVTLLLILSLRHTRAQGTPDPAAGYDLQVYREQLREVERDLARGMIAKEDAERVRVEVSRRILAADARVKATQTKQQSPASVRGVAMLLGVVIIGGSAAMYSWIGEPGYGDLGLTRRLDIARVMYETRPGQSEAEAQVPPAPPLQVDDAYKALIAQLREKVAGQPDDLEGQILLAHHEAQSGNLMAARQAQAKVIELLGDKAGAEEYAQYGELLIVSADGYVSPEAEQLLRKALELDPRHGPASYYWGLMMAQTGRPDLAFRIWDRTLRQSPADAPWAEPIRSLIKEMAWRAGEVDYEPPTVASLQGAPEDAPLAGPSSADIDAAAGMSDEDRQNMIRSMVTRLSDRLASEGGSPQEWARLIGALSVMGDKPRAQSIFDEAREVFAGNDAALGTLGNAASQAGLDK